VQATGLRPPGRRSAGQSPAPGGGAGGAGLPAAAGRRGEASILEGLTLAAVMAAAVALRLYFLGARPLWQDEAYSLGVAARPLGDIPSLLRATDVHPLGYYEVLAVWVRWSGTGLAAARFPSLIFGVAAVFLTWRIGRQWFSPAIGLIAAALVALNPFQIIAANEIRMYPMLECLTLGSSWILWRATRRSPEWPWWAAYGLSAAAMAYTSYYAFVLIPAQAVWAWLSRPQHRRAAAKGLMVAAGVAALCYLPWVLYVIAGPGMGMPRRPAFIPGYLLGLAADQTFGGYLFGAGNYQELGVGLPLRYVVPLLVPFVALLGAGVMLLERTEKASARLVVLSWAGSLLLLLLATAVTGQVAAYPRQLVFLQPFAALLIAGGTMLAWRRLPAARIARPLGACLLVAAFGYPAMAQFNPSLQHYQYDRAAEFVETNYAPGDAIVYFPAGTDVPFRYYFRAPGVQIRVLWDRTRWTREGFEPAIRQATAAVAGKGSGRVWLVYSLPWPRGSLSDLVEALAAKNYRPGPSWDFHDLWVTLLTRADTATR
jgi:mannosyltransferase